MRKYNKNFKLGHFDAEKSSCLLIAEAGVNNNGSLELARKLVDVAKEANADVIKFQTFKTENLVAETTSMAPYQKENLKKNQTQFEMLKKLELSESDFRTLFEYCKKKGIIALSTPFDLESVDLLERLNVPAYKIASGEITNTPLIEKIAKTNKPIILSTGAANYAEINDVVSIASNSSGGLAILHCVTDYPTKFEDLNLNVMKTIEKMFGLPVGFSDHTEGLEASLAAAALEARIIEKHFTLDKNMEGPDHKASLNPDELKQWVRSIRNIEKGLGDGVKRLREREEEIKEYMRKSISAKRDIVAGERVNNDNIAIMRPEKGMPPKYWKQVIGKKTKKGIMKFHPLTWSDIED